MYLLRRCPLCRLNYKMNSLARVTIQCCTRADLCIS
uniref:Uncharacterized protein n=1 Tax=Anguilla anguilla TaxID=7936 RepID=A0A0E9UQN8_ANGAN